MSELFATPKATPPPKPAVLLLTMQLFDTFRVGAPTIARHEIADYQAIIQYAQGRTAPAGALHQTVCDYEAVVQNRIVRATAAREGLVVGNDTVIQSALKNPAAKTH